MKNPIPQSAATAWHEITDRESLPKDVLEDVIWFDARYLTHTFVGCVTCTPLWRWKEMATHWASIVPPPK